MPIKLNGTTIFNEENFADKDLSNLSSQGIQVINNLISSAISGMTYMKNINTKAGILISGASYTTLSNGWLIGNHNGSSTSNVSLTIGNQYLLFPSTASSAVVSLPVCANTEIKVSQTGILNLVFYPEL